MKKTVVTITGIRPDFIRMSEIFRRLDEASWCNHILIHTGQHYDKLLSDIFFEDLQIRSPDYNLEIGSENKKHYHQQAELGPKIIELFHKENINPDIVLFLGDSNSVLASVPLRKEGYIIGHIEAGMRSYDERMLEEINRKVCDQVSNYLFVYHENYKNKAIKEGIREDKIFVVGNTIVEPLKKFANFNYSTKKEHIILDIHRPENFKHPERMQKILNFANFLSKKTNKSVKMLKFNRTIKEIEKHKLSIGDISLIDLMGYKKFITYMQDSFCLISDSGTGQEEPALLNIPVLVPRDFTERPESLESNNSIMVDVFDEDKYSDYLGWVLSEKNSDVSWLGDGTTSEKIIDILEKIL